MPMGRRRQHDKHLPRRVYFHHGAYSFRAPDGRRIRLAKSYHQALLRYAELLEDRTAVTFSDLADTWLAEKLPTLRPSTQADYRNILKSLRAVFGRMRPENIAPRHIYRYRSAWSGPRGNRHVAVLSGILSLGIARGMLDANPCREIERTRESPRDRYVTDAEYLAVRALAGPALAAAMDLALLTGLRRRDLIALHLSQLSADGIRIGTAKTGRRLVITWTPRLRAACKAARAYAPGKSRAMTLLVNTRGERWTHHGFDSAWQRLQQRALAAGALAARFQFRDLRSKATEHAPDGSRLLGHSSPAVTRRHYERHPQRVAPSAGVGSD